MKKELGIEKFNELNPQGADKIKDILGDYAPQLYNQIMEVAFGDLYQRTTLDMKIREAVALASLAIQQSESELKIHIAIAEKLGFSEQELIEVFNQLVPFSGLPSAIFGVKLVKQHFQQ